MSVARDRCGTHWNQVPPMHYQGDHTAHSAADRPRERLALVSRGPNDTWHVD